MKKERMLKKLLNGYKKMLLSVVFGNLRRQEIRERDWILGQKRN